MSDIANPSAAPTKPARQMAGIMSRSPARRSVTSMIAKLTAGPNATILPSSRPLWIPLNTMSETPASASVIVIQVVVRTRSRSTIHPRTAVMNGAALMMKSAFATVVSSSANT